MSEQTLTIESPILNRNERLAQQLRERFRASGTYVVNVLSSPGSGKTSTILATNERLRDRYRAAVIEGDIASDVDAQTMKEAGLDSQLMPVPRTVSASCGVCVTKCPRKLIVNLHDDGRVSPVVVKGA